MEQQSAVEFAVEKLEKLIPSGNQIAIYAILEQAKKMEKKQIIDAWCDGNDSDPKETTGHYAEIYFKDKFKN